MCLGQVDNACLIFSSESALPSRRKLLLIYYRVGDVPEHTKYFPSAELNHVLMWALSRRCFTRKNGSMRAQKIRSTQELSGNISGRAPGRVTAFNGHAAGAAKC